MFSISVLLVVIPIALANIGCPNGWVSNNNECYQFNSSKVTWFRAQQSCLDQGAQLVVVDNQVESDFLKREVRLHHQGSNPQTVGYWTAGNDIQTEGHFVWGFPGRSDLRYTDWFPGEPNNVWYDGRAENCIVIWGHDAHNYQWNDQPCDTLDRYICETNSESEVVV